MSSRLTGTDTAQQSWFFEQAEIVVSLRVRPFTDTTNAVLLQWPVKPSPVTKSEVVAGLSAAPPNPSGIRNSAWA